MRERHGQLRANRRTTASSLIKVHFGKGTPVGGLVRNSAGALEEAKADVVNIGCIPVARAIFEARPDVNTVIHAHPHVVMAVGASETGLLPYSQAA